MARKPASRAEFVTFDVFYKDGSQRSNRKVPSSVLGGIDLDAPALAHHIKTDLLAFVEGAHAGALDRGDVHEHIFPTIRRLYESKPFLRIEKLHGTLNHIWPPLKTPIGVFGYTTIA